MQLTRTAPALLAAAALLAGCGSVAAGGDGGTAQLVASGCPAIDDLQKAQTGGDPGSGVLPEGFTAAAVVTCSPQSRSYAGEGTWTVVVEQKASTDLDGLLSALERPSEPTSGLACPAIAMLVPWFAVVDDQGRWYRPAVPTDGCGQPQTGALAALRDLPFETVSETRVRQEQTPAQAALAARAESLGCSTPFKDMIAIGDADPGQPGGGTGTVLGGSGPLSVCRYAAGTDVDGMPMLTFVSGERLTRDAAAALVAAASVGAPAAPCTTAHREVVGLFPDNGDWALVETDGCRRVMGGSSNVWLQADPGLLAALR